MLRYLPPLLIALLACCTLGVWETLAYGFVVAPFAFFWSACPCCDGNCTIFTDDFSTDRTGTDYTVVSGSWSVGSGVLSTSSASALILSNTAMGAGATGVHSTVSVGVSSTANVARLIVGQVDANNYWFAEVQPGASSGTLKLYEVVAGVSTQRDTTKTLNSFDTSAGVTVCVSIGGGYVRAKATHNTFNNSAAIRYAASPTVASTKCGLATGASSTAVTFDGFEINKHFVDDPLCGLCGVKCSSCIDDHVADRLQVDLDGFVDGGGCGGSANCNGPWSFILERDTSLSCFWTLSVTGVCCITLGDIRLNRVVAFVDASSGVDYELVVEWLQNGNPNTWFEWRVTLATIPTESDCLSWDHLPLPLTEANCTACDGSSATCEVTSLA